MFDRNNPVEEFFTEEEQQKLSGLQWSCLLRERPEFEKYFRDEFQQKLDGFDWGNLLHKCPQYEKYFTAEVQQKLRRLDWCALLVKNPQFGKYFVDEFHHKLDGPAWCYLVSNRPEFLQLVPDQYKFILNCGDEKRAIWIDASWPETIYIGCFDGTREQAIQAISEKYSGKERDSYIAKVNECFGLVE